jgi:hypothetical protein
MAAYVEGSVRLRWIDRTRRAAGCGGTGPLGDPNYLVSGRIGPGNTRGRNVAFIGRRSNPTSTSLGERIDLFSSVENAKGIASEKPPHRYKLSFQRPFLGLSLTSLTIFEEKANLRSQ